jgi:hypothetical protein
MHIVHLEQINRLAAAAAEQRLGPRANPYPDGSAAHAAWLSAYDDCMRKAEGECLQ